MAGEVVDMTGWDRQTTAQVSTLTDDLLVAALRGALTLHGDMQSAEDYLRDRIVALADTHTDAASLDAAILESITREVVDTTS